MGSVETPDEFQKPPRRLSGRAMLLGAAGALLWVAGIVISASVWSDSRVVFWVAILSLLAVVAAVGVLLAPDDRSRYGQLGLRVAELSALVAMAIYISVLFVGLPALAWALVIKASQPENPIVRLPLAGLLLVILVGLLLVPRYKRTADSLHSQPLFARVWLYAVTVLFFAAGVFANITWELQQRGALQLCSEPQSDNGVGNGCTEPVTIDEIGNFYIYQLVNALPGNIPQNLDLSPPLYYEQRHVGILVILFTLVVTLPTINFMITAVRQGRRTSEAERLLKLGEHLDQRNDIEGAIRAYQGAADLGPAKVVSTATDKLGELRKRQKDNARAARAYQLALDS